MKTTTEGRRGDGAFACGLRGHGQDAAGYASSSTFGPGEPGETVLSCRDQRDFFLARFAPDGSCDWATSSKSTDDWTNWTMGQTAD